MRLAHYLIIESNSNHHIPNMRFLNALTTRSRHTKSFCFCRAKCVKYVGDHPTTNCLCREKSKDFKCILCERNHPANYKGCIVYKDLRRNFFPTLRRKLVISEPQPRTKQCKYTNQTCLARKIICFSRKN